jgi:hypothetical protein
MTDLGITLTPDILDTPKRVPWEMMEPDDPLAPVVAAVMASPEPKREPWLADWPVTSYDGQTGAERAAARLAAKLAAWPMHPTPLPGRQVRRRVARKASKRAAARAVMVDPTNAALRDGKRAL